MWEFDSINSRSLPFCLLYVDIYLALMSVLPSLRHHRYYNNSLDDTEVTSNMVSRLTTKCFPSFLFSHRAG